MASAGEIFDKTAVVITNYNKHEYISDAIQSVLAQTANLIIVDDCSSDGSRQIIERTGCKHVIFHEVNSGASQSYLNGINEAMKLGFDFVVTLDGDDVLAGNAVEYYAKTLAKTGADAVMSGVRRTYKGDCRKFVRDCDFDAEITVYDDPLSYWMKRGKGSSCVCARAKSLVANIDPSLYVQDHQMAFSVHYNSNKVVYSRAITHYCSPGIQPQSLSNNELAKVCSYTGQFVYHYPLVKDHPELCHYVHRAFHKALNARRLGDAIGKPYAAYLGLLRFFRDFIPQEKRISVIREVHKRLQESNS